MPTPKVVECCLKKEKGKTEEERKAGHWERGTICLYCFLLSQFCLQRIRQGLVFYKHLLDSDIFTGEPALLPDSPVEQLHTSLMGLSQLLQVRTRDQEDGASQCLKRKLRSLVSGILSDCVFCPSARRSPLGDSTDA